MDNNNKQGRDYGLDLMRVLTTVFVVGIHVLQRGGMLGVCRDSSPRRGFVAIGLFFAVTCAVNGFALISGYVGISSKYRFSRILWLYFTVSFYNVLIPAVFRFRYGYVIDDTVKLRALFPFAYEANWYFTAYLGMFLLIPFLNAAVKHLAARHHTGALDPDIPPRDKAVPRRSRQAESTKNGRIIISVQAPDILRELFCFPNIGALVLINREYFPAAVAKSFGLCYNNNDILSFFLYQYGVLLTMKAAPRICGQKERL